MGRGWRLWKTAVFAPRCVKWGGVGCWGNGRFYPLSVKMGRGWILGETAVFVPRWVKWSVVGGLEKRPFLFPIG